MFVNLYVCFDSKEVCAPALTVMFGTLLAQTEAKLNAQRFSFGDQPNAVR